MDALEAIMTRRSTRAFKKEGIDPEKLEKLIEAGRYAPSGGNTQAVRFIVIQNRDVLRALAEAAQEAFSRMEVEEGMYRSMKNSILRAKKGGYVFHYDPAALIVAANRKSHPNNIADCACALENMMVAANALDLGSCWINQLKWLNEDEKLLSMLREMGMKEDERVYGALAVGIADTEDALPCRTPLPRTGNEVVYIR